MCWSKLNLLSSVSPRCLKQATVHCMGYVCRCSGVSCLHWDMFSTLLFISKVSSSIFTRSCVKNRAAYFQAPFYDFIVNQLFKNHHSHHIIVHHWGLWWHLLCSGSSRCNEKRDRKGVKRASISKSFMYWFFIFSIMAWHDWGWTVSRVECKHEDLGHLF